VEKRIEPTQAVSDTVIRRRDVISRLLRMRRRRSGDCSGPPIPLENA